MARPLPPPLNVVPHTEKEGEKQRQGGGRGGILCLCASEKPLLSPISKSGLLSGCSLGGGKAHLIFYACSHFPFSLCIPALQPTLLDGDSLSSKEPIQFHITLADPR